MPKAAVNKQGYPLLRPGKIWTAGDRAVPPPSLQTSAAQEAGEGQLRRLVPAPTDSLHNPRSSRRDRIYPTLRSHSHLYAPPTRTQYIARTMPAEPDASHAHWFPSVPDFDASLPISR